MSSERVKRVIDTVTRLRDFVSRITQLSVDETEYAYLKSLVLFSPGEILQFCATRTSRCIIITRLHPFACSLLYNATAMCGALWWVRQSHSVNYVAPSGDCERVISWISIRHSPGCGTTFAKRRHDASNYISPLSFGKSFMKIRSAVPENGCLIVLVDGKNKKQKKTTTKHIRIRLLPEGGCVNNKIQYISLPQTETFTVTVKP